MHSGRLAGSGARVAEIVGLVGAGIALAAAWNPFSLLALEGGKPLALGGLAILLWVGGVLTREPIPVRTAVGGAAMACAMLMIAVLSAMPVLLGTREVQRVVLPSGDAVVVTEWSLWLDTNYTVELHTADGPLSRRRWLCNHWSGTERAPNVDGKDSSRLLVDGIPVPLTGTRNPSGYCDPRVFGG